MPDIQETASRRDLSRADLIKAEDELVVAQRELQEMLGRAPLELVAIKHDFVPQPLTPPTEAGWMAMAMANNAEILSAQQNLRVADHEIERPFGGPFPTLDGKDVSKGKRG